jgi:tRNA dimethylallyltransferase
MILAGPTAIGKSSIGVKIAQQLGAHIINADSVQMYKECTIGSNKITEQHMQGVPHHLLNTLSLRDQIDPESTSAVGFIKSATKIIENTQAPCIISGGAAYYLHQLMKGIPEHAASKRTIEEKQAFEKHLRDENDWEKSIQKLRDFNPELANTITLNNYQRLARALELVENEQFVTKVDNPPPYDFRAFVLTSDRLPLYRHIDARCEQIVENGLFEEVAYLLSQKLLNPSVIPWSAIGYKQSIELFQLPYDTITTKDFLHFLSKYKTATRNYAKRQLAWFRRPDSPYVWINVDTVSTAQIEEIYNMPRIEYEKYLVSSANRQVIDASVGVNTGKVDPTEAKRAIQEQIDNLYEYKNKYLVRDRVEKINKLRRSL